MKRWFICGTILVLLLLSGCGKNLETEEESPLSKAAGIELDAVLLCVDGQEQPAWRYLYWLARDCIQLQEQYNSANLTLDWDAPLESGGTLAKYAKEQALADAALFAVVEEWAQIYHCVPEAEENITTQWSDMFLTQEQARELEEIGRAYGKLYDLYRTPGSLLAPVEGELEHFAREQGVVEIDRILIADKGDRAAAKQKAEELFARFNNAENQAEMFLELAASGDDTIGPRSLKNAEWEQCLMDAARTMEAGQYSGILESQEGFSILRCLPNDTVNLEGEYFDFLLQSAAENCEIQTTEPYEKIDVAKFCAELQREKQK
ncbi:MAG: hypothetical protein MJ073_03330 [Oscillibacter sp.]|nr:hypothetical protein [Oscillibacter sp.]